MNENIAVKTNNLTKVFDKNTAVENLNIEVRKGELFGLVGPDGAGKTTVMRLLAAIMQPTSGEAWVAGHSIIHEGEKIKERIGYMPQRFGLYEDLTVEENINFFSGVYNVPKDKRAGRKEWVIEMAGLRNRNGAVTKTLAGGFKQRLALGCAILHEPPIIFLDEPTSGVDPISRRNFWDLINGMSGAGTTVFVTTHYMDEADYCDRLALIYRGRIVAEGTPVELRQKYMQRSVLEIEVDRTVEALEILLGSDIDAAIFGSTIHTTVEDAIRDIPRIKKVLEEKHIGVGRVEEIVPSLEDVFVALIETS